MPVRTRRGHTGRYRQDQAFGRPFKKNKYSPQAKGLVGWFPVINQHAGDITEYVSSSNGILNGTLSWSRDRYGSIIHAPSETSGNYVGTGSLFGLTGSYSFSCWVKLNSITTRGIFLVTDSNETGGMGIGVGDTTIHTTGQNFLGLTVGVGNLVPSPSVPMGTSWHHCLLVYDGTNAFLYFDGGEVFSGATTPNVATGEVIFASFSTVSTRTPIADYFDFRLWNRALSPSEVYQLYAPSTRWDLYAPRPRVFPVGVPAAEVGDSLASLSDLRRRRFKHMIVR